MSSGFLDYLDPNVPLEERLREVFDELRIENDRRDGVETFMRLLKVKDRATYEHSVRVGLLTRQIGRFIHLDERALLYAGLLHDIGKAQTRLETLKKTVEWTPADAVEVRSHVIDGYRLLRGYFDFSAEIILWHHRFQPNGYPTAAELPSPLHDYSEGTKTMVAFYGRVLSLADAFDAMHRLNEKFGAEPLSGEEIKKRMLAASPDQRTLIEELYGAGIFTTRLFNK